MGWNIVIYVPAEQIQQYKKIHWQCTNRSDFQVTPFTKPGRGQMISKGVKKWICNKTSNHQCVLKALLTPFSFSEVYVINYDKLPKFSLERRTKGFS